jgi:hypothetical protein
MYKFNATATITSNSSTITRIGSTTLLKIAAAD